MLRASMIWDRQLADCVDEVEATRRVDTDLAAFVHAFARACAKWLEQLRTLVQTWLDAVRPVVEGAYRQLQAAGHIPGDPPLAPRTGPPLPRLDGRRR